jgi:hypothetical protein
VTPCRCDHPGEFHQRGWGPCRFVCTRFVIGRDGGQYAVVQRCDCRRFVSANHPAGKGIPENRNPRFADFEQYLDEE